MKKAAAFLLAAALALILPACNNSQSTVSTPDAQSPASPQRSEAAQASEPASVPVLTQEGEESAGGRSDPDIVTAADGLAFPLGAQMPAGAFTGEVYLAQMIANDETYHFPAANSIIFEPGARSRWHSHGGSADTSFAHIAVNTNPELAGLQWFDRISNHQPAPGPSLEQHDERRPKHGGSAFPQADDAAARDCRGGRLLPMAAVAFPVPKIPLPGFSRVLPCWRTGFPSPETMWREPGRRSPPGPRGLGFESGWLSADLAYQSRESLLPDFELEGNLFVAPTVRMM